MPARRGISSPCLIRRLLSSRLIIAVRVSSPWRAGAATANTRLCFSTVSATTLCAAQPRPEVLPRSARWSGESLLFATPGVFQRAASRSTDLVVQRGLCNPESSHCIGEPGYRFFPHSRPVPALLSARGTVFAFPTHLLGAMCGTANLFALETERTYPLFVIVLKLDFRRFVDMHTSMA